MEVFALIGMDPALAGAIAERRALTDFALLVFFGSFVLSLVLSRYGVRSCFFPGLFLILFLFLLGVAAIEGEANFGWYFDNCSVGTALVGVAIVVCQVALKFRGVKEALGIKDSGLPPPWEYGQKWAGPEPPSAAIQDHPPDKWPDGVSPP